MDVEFIQKVCKNGSSANVTLNRTIMRRLHVRPGDFLQVMLGDDDVVRIQRWIKPGTTQLRSPGLMLPEPSAPPR